MKRSWIKLYLEILDDPKLAGLPEAACWRFVQLLLVAAESDEGGILPTSKRLAWRVRMDQAQLLDDLRAMSEVGIVCRQGERWKVTNFEKRQAGLSGAERVTQHRERRRHGGVTEDVTKSYSERVTDSSSLSDSVSESGGEGAGEGGIPPLQSVSLPATAGPSTAMARSEFLDQGAGKTEAQRVLLQAAGLAALPPSEVARVEQVRRMVASYGSEKTLGELRVQRGEWCKTRGRNGKFYSPLNMGWVDRADAALAEERTPEKPPYDPYAPLKRYLERIGDADD